MNQELIAAEWRRGISALHAEAFLRRIREYLLEQGVAPASLPLTPPKR